MSTAPAWIRPSAAAALEEALTLAEWAELLGVHRNALYKNAPKEHAGMREVNGLLTRVFRSGQLGTDRQEQLLDVLHRANATSFRYVLDLRRANRQRWTPDFSFASKPPAEQQRALARREVMRVYFGARNSGQKERVAVERACAMWAERLGERCAEKTVRRWAKKVDACGGIETAPLEAYCGNKDVPHPNARLEVRHAIPQELIAAFRCKCVKPGMGHMRAAHRELQLAWLAGEEVPGLGTRQGGADFPFTFAQLRKFAPSTPARLLGSHGKARALREALPHTRSTRAALSFGQRYVFDDSRADIIATDDRTGEPVELKFYIAMDAASRSIVGYILRQSRIGGGSAIRADDVDALVGRVLAGSGFATPQAGWCTELKFERGTVACSPAKQTLLEGLYPGLLKVSRTEMEGGRNFAGDFAQDSSGNWKGKAEIESFMRTLAFFCQHLPGQRGGDYRRQPAHLGLKGRNPATGLLAYHAGSQMHEAARLQYADRALAIIEPTEAQLAEVPGLAWRGERLKVTPLKPVSWVQDAVKQVVAFYNARTEHRMEGFDRIEYLGENGELKRRMESPNERATRLLQACPTQRLDDAGLVPLLNMRPRAVVVKPNGVTITIGNYERCLFWREDSIACAQAARNSTLEKKFVALIDEDAFETWTPENGNRREIYLLSDSPADWQPGMPGRFLEALPLARIPDRTSPEEMADAKAQRQRVVGRYMNEVLHAAGPRLAQELADLAHNERELHGVVTRMRTDRVAGESQLARELREARERADAAVSVEKPTRASQAASNRTEWAKRLAAKSAEVTEP